MLAAVLARRGIERVIATDCDPRALACAARTSSGSGWRSRWKSCRRTFFPTGGPQLVVCNPPWIPARPSSPIERGIYDPESRMLRRFLGALPEHLEPGGEGWLILSDLAEHLGLRPRSELLAAFRRGRVAGRGSKRCAAETSPGVRRNRPAARGARSRGDIALAPRRALSWALSREVATLHAAPVRSVRAGTCVRHRPDWFTWAG